MIDTFLNAASDCDMQILFLSCISLITTNIDRLSPVSVHSTQFFLSGIENSQHLSNLSHTSTPSPPKHSQLTYPPSHSSLSPSLSFSHQRISHSSTVFSFSSPRRLYYLCNHGPSKRNCSTGDFPLHIRVSPPDEKTKIAEQWRNLVSNPFRPQSLTTLQIRR
jgi:hypothetical protein